MTTQLGRITKATFGYGGYQDVQIVYTFELEGPTWSKRITYECGWGHVSEEDLQKPDNTCKWTHDSRIQQLGKQSWKVFKLIEDAKVKSLDQLVGIPIKLINDDYFEILTEVL